MPEPESGTNTNRIPAKSAQATRAHALVQSLQQELVRELTVISRIFGDDQAFAVLEWFRDTGQHGGGLRYGSTDATVFNRASVNVSQVHYDDEPEKPLGSATALSAIVHPKNPYAPSVHMHISWTEMKNGTGFWRVMADLNPALADALATEVFTNCLKESAPAQYQQAVAQGDHYFYIPALERHRGVRHFYLEQYRSADPEADFVLARTVGESVIQCYASLLREAIPAHPEPTVADRAAQLAYHTLYLFQVLTLDRGTTSGLLVHDQNDVGILGSLPACVDKSLLASWQNGLPAPQDRLLASIIAVLPDDPTHEVTDAVKQALADAVRRHYKTYPEALAYQASAEVETSTVANHR